ncbi:ASCH domain-containing protein [Trichocoleus desertorum AS-A10]|uniref:ASCH domain-containing protein n=1 Tax=Trichocoleus desertorum TaxID=1481672 RepID=UPI003296F744
MRILTLWQPWASLIALNLKRYETRSWGTDYRGKLAIHAAKRPIVRDELQAIAYAMGGCGCSMTEFAHFEQAVEQDLPLGAIVAIADLTDCPVMRLHHPQAIAGIEIEAQSPLEQSVGLWESGRYAWKLENVIALPEPIPFRGGQGLRVLSDETVLQAIAQQTEV